ncbi:uncharacterized protein BCR38DRAFT_471125 [Pseudomassariella vexata]|uniref:Nephrocystin 3-like N-terminal domain-containing protein n=1 Tax=Pseudomassariella vexata TaxID=1141098 RepID=A0A1Y2EEG1_9PEZI|nr:uncharacterized protein BCR38DRAFT_471125 [Pseudomassariella vexata]ORY69656.1 hypothetical protein BCR38DRAFT_471125 [Pseudomassariella vexata]
MFKHDVVHAPTASTCLEVLGAIVECLQQLGELVQNEVPQRSLSPPTSSFRASLSKTLDRLAWPVTKCDKANDLLQKLEGHKATVDWQYRLALRNHPLRLHKPWLTLSSVAIDDLRQGIQQQAEAQVSDRERQAILAWLEPKGINTMNNDIHEDKVNLQEKGTCNWMTESMYWPDWLERGSSTASACQRFLWIHGMPGAGKTILASYLIEQVAMHCKRHGYSYYYCSHERRQDETQAFLRWAISDLSIQLGSSVPQELADLYARRDTSTKGLRECLLAVTKKFKRQRVYIIVDAVDESEFPRTDFLDVLTYIGLGIRARQYGSPKRRLPSDPPNGASPQKRRMEPNRQMSRFPVKYQLEASCETALGRESAAEPPKSLEGAETSSSGVKPCTVLSMSNSFVQKAIRTFVEQKLENSELFRNCSRPAFVEKVETLLAAKANGMFRWVACQFDVLNRQKYFDEDEILQAIRDLPIIVFETYERIILDGLSDGQKKNEHNRTFARTALALICSNTSAMPSADVLVQASRFNVPHGTANNYTRQRLRNILGCLVKVTALRKPLFSCYKRDDESGDHMFRFSPAHYTVKEYLFSKATAAGPAHEFALPDHKTQVLELQVAFNGLQQHGKGRNAFGQRILTRYEEYCISVTDQALEKRPSIIVEESVIWEAVFPCLKWNSAHQSAFTNKTTRNYFANWAKLQVFAADDHEPDEYETCILTKTAVWADEFIIRDSPQTVLQMCVSRRHKDFLDLFIEEGASFIDEPNILFAILKHPYGIGDSREGDDGSTTGQFIKTLLASGANPNPLGYMYTPLQDAVCRVEKGWVHDLITYGADPNAVGDPMGPHPYGLENPDAEETWWYGEHPLVICAQLEVSRGSETTNKRDRIVAILLSSGAVDPNADAKGKGKAPKKRPDVIEIDD